MQTSASAQLRRTNPPPCKIFHIHLKGKGQFLMPENTRGKYRGRLNYDRRPMYKLMLLVYILMHDIQADLIPNLPSCGIRWINSMYDFQFSQHYMVLFLFRQRFNWSLYIAFFFSKIHDERETFLFQEMRRAFNCMNTRRECGKGPKSSDWQWK